MIEAIARQYITGSMWRDYSKGGREFCGILKGIPGVPEVDDVNISRMDIDKNLQAFNF